MRILLVFSIFVLSACAHSDITYTPTQKIFSNEVGYYEIRHGTNKWAVGYQYAPGQRGQQISNVIMMRASTIAQEHGYLWVRVLNEKDEMNNKKMIVPGMYNARLGQIYSLEGGTISYNADAFVPSDLYGGSGARYTLNYVLYFEFRKNVDCSVDGCDDLEYTLEKCSGEENPFYAPYFNMCPDKIKTDNSCAEYAEYHSKSLCSDILHTSSTNRGFIEEFVSKKHASDWYPVKYIQAKYSERYNRLRKSKKPE